MSAHHTLRSVAVVAAVSALLVVAPADAHAAATCNGRTATIVGTTGNDVITGTDGADVIAGLGGNDRIDAKAGNDLICPFTEWRAGTNFTTSIVGGSGTDTLSLRDYTATAKVDLGAGTLAVAGATGILASIENFTGSSQASSLVIGTTGPNKIRIAVGRVEPMGGNDTIISSSAPNTTSPVIVDYHRATSAVVVDLAAGSTTGWSNDILTYVTGVTGTPFADVLRGTKWMDFIDGGGGADTINGGAGHDNISWIGSKARVTAGDGNDYLFASTGWASLDGGPGNDFVNMYYVFGGSTGIHVDLGLGTVATASQLKTFTGIEAVQGTAHDDTLIGDGNDNRFEPEAGRDTIRGLGGQDTIFAADGMADTVDGGDGSDPCATQDPIDTIVSCELPTPRGD